MNIAVVGKCEYLAHFEQVLKDLLVGQNLLDEGMRYATLDGGKRVRPLCVYYGARAVGGNVEEEQVINLAIAVELVHSYSLVHDDLPAMDNDDYRRGKLSTHKKFGHANGILVGDQLLTTAMQVLLEGARKYGNLFANAAKEIALGAKNMAYGQCLDLEGCKNADEYLDMYAKKTGALILSSMRAGAICAGAQDLQHVSQYAKCIGLAFQLADDLLDNEEDNSILSVLSASDVRHMLSNQTEQALLACQNLVNKNELEDFANALLTRTK